MLISVSLENWMSYRDKVIFSMIASNERQHGKRLPFITKYRMRLLPTAAIYGANASGKTNFFRALSFVKKLVVRGTQQPEELISVEPFSLDEHYKQMPTRFSFELLIEDIIYEFSFSLNSNEILDEKLVRVDKNKEHFLYNRQNGQISFNKHHKYLEELKFLEFVATGTRKNQLFLTNSLLLNVNSFKLISDWFKNTLQLVNPATKFNFFHQGLSQDDSLYKLMNYMLEKLDTGITEIKVEEIPIDDVGFPQLVRDMLMEFPNDGVVFPHPTIEGAVLTREEGKLIAKKLTTYHQGVKGNKVPFELKQESDGTIRIIDLLPNFLQLFMPDSKKVYVVDEINRSLHTLLSKKLIEDYLNYCEPESRNQLLFTTHDVLLMDQAVLRRDEMWVTERDQDGATTIYSFSEYKDVRYDKDLRKSYLQGRLGGIPKLLVDDGYSKATESIR